MSDRMSQYRRARRGRSIVVTALIAVFLFVAGCSGTPPATQASAADGFDVSYAGAAGRLAGLDATDSADQIRDWLVVALAQRLGMSTAHLRDATYDSLPVRDPGLADLTDEPTGPGRYLDDGTGVLHLLVPQGDPHLARTIGLLLDQYRTDAGADTPRVQVDHYRIDTAARTVHVTTDASTSTAALRTSDGYVSQRVDSTASLTSFLDHTSSLSRLVLHGSQVWAEGWNWPAPADAKVDLTDVTVLQDAYDKQQPPDFSLDPQPARTAADLTAIVPGLSPSLAGAIVGKGQPTDGYPSPSALDNAVFGGLDGRTSASELRQHGLPTDRTQLWALDWALTGAPVYSQARYDGGIADTAVGMTLFYTDRTGKDWVNGVGSGVPSNTDAPGFLPNDKAIVPISECTTQTSELGRLWFGENDAAIAMHPDSVDIGARATRLFSLDDGPGGQQTEPSYGFARGMNWWDSHYQEIADYEPQYQRLEQIMRWSEALDWLVGRADATLPKAPASTLHLNESFATWYARHPELKAHEPIDFVRPPSANGNEALAPVPSMAYQQCGKIAVEGGVTLGDLVEVEGNGSYTADLPASVDRAGPLGADSTFDEQTGTGRITQVTLNDDGLPPETVQRVFTVGSDGSAVITSTGAGRQVEPLGDLKILGSSTADRTVALTISASRGEVSEQVDLQGMEVGTLSATAQGDRTDVVWQPGPVDRTLAVLDSLTAEWKADPTPSLPTAASGALAEYRTADGLLYRVGDQPTDPWLAVGTQPPAAGGLAFRFGVIDPRTSLPMYGYSGFADPPRPPPGDWVSAVPAGHGTSLLYTSTGAPNGSATSIPVHTPDGRTSTLYVDNGTLLMSATDPVLGPAGTVAGEALLNEFGTVARTMTTAQQAGDGLLRGMVLDGGTVVLVAPDQIFLAPSNDPVWAERVLHETGGKRDDVVFVRLMDGKAWVIDPTNLGPPDMRYTTTLGTVRNTANATAYMNDVFRATLSFGAGPGITTTSLPDQTQVTVLRYTLTAAQLAHAGAGGPPDGRRSGGGNWWRLAPNNSQSQITSAVPVPAPELGPAPTESGDVVLLVCPHVTTGVAGCQA